MTEATAGGTIHGRVIDGQRGMAGVAVSDGLHVTLTDDDGAFTLPGHGPFVTLTRPSGWTTDRWYLPAEAGGADLEFVLTPQEQPLPLTFVHVSDLHVSLGETDLAPDGSDATIWFADGAMRERVVTSPRVIADLWQDVARRVPDAAFVAATGDLTNTGSDGEYAAWVAAAQGSPVPIVAIPGNHDHHAQADELPDDATGVDFHAVPSRYERHLGPRWFSFDHAGLHVVAIDWFTHLLGIDTDVQEAWLRADLALVPEDRAIVLLSHDQMPTAFFERLPRHPVATFSGHWHTSRVARVDGALHVNTPTATFGGLDYSPAAMRVVRWDGREVALETIARTDDGFDGFAAATYRAAPRSRAADSEVARLPGAVHRAGPTVVGDLVVATSRDEDAARGWLTAVDRRTGAVVWQVDASSPVKASPCPVGGGVVMVDVTGETTCVELDGTVRWRRHIDDPLRLWTYLAPTTHADLVYVGDVARFVALDHATGTEAWVRTDLGQRENITSWADPTVVDGTLLVAFAGQTPVLYGLDPATGATRWPVGESGRSIYRGTAVEVAMNLPRTIVAPPLADPEGSDAYVVRLGAMVERIRAADGSSVWAVPHHGWFNPGRLAILDDLVVAITGMGRMRAYARSTGDLAWEAEVGRPAPLAAGPYRAGGPLALGGVATAGDRLLAPLGDGSLVTVAGDGSATPIAALGAPCLAAPALDGDHAWVATVDGGLHRVPLPA